MIDRATRLRLRPSVSVVPFEEDGHVQCEFFLGNTRRMRRFVVERELFTALSGLDGVRTLEEALGHRVGSILDRFIEFCEVLLGACVLESVEVSDAVERLPTRRVARFLQDYFPGDEVLGALVSLASSRIIILGVGGVGSWVAHLLARTGVGSVVLVDDDDVDVSNLNRSLFDFADVGMPKVVALGRTLDQVVGGGQSFAMQIRTRIESSADLVAILDSVPADGRRTVVVNCADHPNVDETARMVGEVCLLRRIPHIIAGGYNLHLSLVGPTIVPFESACVECIRLGLDELRPVEHSPIRKLVRKSRKIGSLGPLVAVGATYVANEVIRCALSGARLRPIMMNRRAEVNFVTGALSNVDLPRRPDCSWCGRTSCAS